VIYDPAAKHVISAATHHMDVDYSCYEGRQVQGASEIVLLRGRVIVEGGVFLGREGAGKFLRRDRAEYARRAL
jgi:dihydropyrimidinase